ncbi:MAG: glycosyltransferase family 39 protein [Bacteroidia bacterium]|nr:glycosyltransferase family 39 protein [Bacteroidia bacterium]
MHHKLKLSAIAAWGAILFIPFLGASHLFDWDEINFAESAREMLLTGEYFRVQINFKPFWEKPPLFFWLQTLSYKTFGINEFAARFPNAICGILVLATVYHIGRTHFNSRIALLWVFFITGSFTPHLYYKSGIIDPWFNYFIFLSVYQLFLATINEEKRTKHFIYMGLFNGLAILTKGPVALLILGICGLVLLITRKFKPYFNVVQLLLAVIPIVAITSIWFLNEWIKNGSQVLVDFIAYQIDLFVNPVAGHGQPWFLNTS